MEVNGPVAFRMMSHGCVMRITEIYTILRGSPCTSTGSDVVRSGSSIMYLPGRVLQQFGYVQTIPRHLDASANLVTSSGSNTMIVF
ncbi:hypothetical protein L195_g022178 [Trifolium pratense]|uniref:Uncharacterized protein n=1 Tax=Trifolium pratense TaxID=57577 RepID=A0A2K3N7B9_TRIPR|nr:hypothetical protein L195_g022178 [Trifolium pratense]